jgi:hypothetical protein
MSMVANDRWPDVPMATQGTNPWHEDSLGDETPAVDNIPGGQNLMTIGDDGGFEWQRVHPYEGRFYQPTHRVPHNTTVRQA